jgi:hypothetical protein
MSSDQDTEKTRALYGELTKVATTFWEWRDKVMTRFFAVVTASAAMAGWFYQQPELRAWSFFPFALASGFAVFSAVMDRVNTKILRECCYPVGKRLELELSESGGIFTAIHDSPQRPFSYQWVFRAMYVASSVVFAVVSIAVASATR